MRLTLTLAAALLAASTALHAQAPSDTGKGRRFDCSQAKDPKACEERRTNMKAAHDKARAACEGKKDQEHRDCMRQQFCSSAKDPKACEERMNKAKAGVDKARQACEGKKGDAHRDCMRHEVCAQTKDPAGCEAKAKERMEKRQQRRQSAPQPKG